MGLWTEFDAESTATDGRVIGAHDTNPEGPGVTGVPADPGGTRKGVVIGMCEGDGPRLGDEDKVFVELEGEWRGKGMDWDTVEAADRALACGTEADESCMRWRFSNN